MPSARFVGTQQRPSREERWLDTGAAGRMWMRWGLNRATTGAHRGAATRSATIQQGPALGPK
eukprot:9036397-Alexandrium_andersonii.AAC.1